MSERFWAPTRPTITPDAVAVALLTPHGGDRAGDLGASLLGMHRAGAAACEAIAKGAVPSEKRLLEALAKCRSAMGGQAADAVSKSMEARYAGLLVRDLLDDAETAAAGLYRACVTKGVAPPLAASRVGAVYGVPSSELGRYRALATDPRVNPIALTDAADRTLLGYVAKVVAAEVGEVKEEVSKADDDFDEREHPRDTSGRFTAVIDAPQTQTAPVAPAGAAARLRARLGLTEAAPEVVVAPEPKTRQRVQRRQRVKRRMSTETGELKATGSTLKHKLKAKVETAAKRSTKLRHDLQMKTTVSHQLEKHQLEADPFDLKTEFSGTNQDNMMALPMPLSRPGEYATTYQKLGFVMQHQEGLAFQTKTYGTGRHDDPRRFRAGWLVEAASQPASMEERDDGKPNQIEGQLDIAADIAKLRISDIGGTGPVVAHLNPKKMAGTDRERFGYVAGVKRDLARSADWVDRSVEEQVDEEESYFLQMAELNTGEEVLLHFQPVYDRNGEIEHPFYRPYAIVHEYVMQGEAFSGRVDGTGNHPNDQWLIDPNQAIKLEDDYEPFWDSKRGVVVHVHQIRPISEADVNFYEKNYQARGGDDPFNKALEGVEAVEFEHEHPRDTGGRFATKHSAPSGVAPTATLERSAPADVTGAAAALRERLGLSDLDLQPVARTRTRRQVRQRVKRRMAPAPAPLVAQSVQRSSLLTHQVADRQLRHQQLAHSVNLAITSRLAATPDLPVLNESSDFVVLNKGDWRVISEVLSEDQEAQLDKKGGTIEFRGLFRQRVLDRAKHQADEAKARVIGNAVDDLLSVDRAMQRLVDNGTEDLYTNPHDTEEKPLGEPFQYTGEDNRGNVRTKGEHEEWSRSLGDRIFDEFDKHPEIDQISVYEDPSSGWVQLYGNSRPVAKQYIVEIENHIDLANHEGLTLMHVGSYRTKNVTVDSDGELRPLLPVDADTEGIGALSLPVQIFRVIAPKVGYGRVDFE